ncbi:putative ABC transport system permease protein [Arcticibacter tournemirensis]|uniref:FtsX-like permease family protein n=1 Tax=Arcticibacter tournemirensis TaxID=699437 RepID=A0A5M9GSW2_9SPHI|nr:ABC transporter permease [Arcticibacter tournemirensis]KAA8476811.1 FtsX-like permease family protein [Arcticibacter tournemirensis]TQM50830.1 putative ABC transport system permease protein [Arcticibacter tournemirensis]
MIRHFFQIAWRNLLKRKFYSFINITGLAIGMTCCVLISLYIRNELSYDQYHVKKDRIYRVLQTFRSVQDGETLSSATPGDYQVWGCAPVGPALQADFPEVEKVVQFMSPVSLLLEKGEKRFQQDNLLCMDSTAFDVFSWKMLYGDPRTALTAPNSIVLTHTVAQKFFGNENPVGQMLRVDSQYSYMITGVMEDVPPNSQFTFNGLISMSTVRKYRAEMFDWWGYVDFYTYVLLKKNTSISSLDKQSSSFVKRRNSGDKGYAISFEKMTDAYLHSAAKRQPGPTGSLLNVYLFSCIAVFIMLIACINFMNLSTARSLERAKEIGVRKVLGVRPSSLMIQFLSESILLSLSAAVIALVLAQASIPMIGKLSGKDLSYTNFLTPLLPFYMTAFAVVVGLLAGIYPAWFLSGFRAISVLKGKFKPPVEGVSFRKVLVVFQFTLSVALIAATAIVYSQLKYVNRHDLGFQKDQMLVLNFEGDEKVQQNIEIIKKAIADQPGVVSVAASRAVPGEFLPNAGTQIQTPQGQMAEQAPFIYEIDFDFIPTYHIPVIAGRPYSRSYTTDSAQAMVINEAAARLYGYTRPADAVGKKFDQWGRSGTIIGVVKDFNFRSLHQAVEPLTLRYGYSYSLNRISVAIKGDNVPETLAGLRKTWSQIVPHRPFLYQFLDESFSAQYEADQHFGQLFTFFSCLAIFIACLGLFGLSTFMAQQRVKEIGIRKVLGSSVSGIVILLSKDFIKLILIGIIIAVPLCWWAMDKWLQGFAYRINVGPLVFIEAGLIAMSVALITIAWQSVKAAMGNPVQSLRNE